MTFSGNVLMSVLVGAVAFYVPNFQLKRNRRKNLEKFNLFFRNTLIRMASMLRAGGSTKQAILGIAQNNDTNEIVRNEFKRAYTDLEFGYTVEEAFMRMYHRTGSEDVRIVSIVMEIQRQKGGNLAELLDSLQQTITERQNQKRRIKTLTAAQTSQANLLTAIPFLVFGFFWIYNPSYYKEFFENIIGVFMTIVCVILIFIGNFIMRKMASPK
nr:type II secretion system F family protein [Neobacillus paridis]